MLYNIIIIIQVLSALAIIVLVLMQHGKGADMGAAFGAGASGSIFGATGSSNFLSRSTALAAVVFFVSTLAMAYLGPYRAPAQSGIIEKLQSVTSPAPAQQDPQADAAVKEATGAAAIPSASQSVPGAGENTSK